VDEVDEVATMAQPAATMAVTVSRAVILPARLRVELAGVVLAGVVLADSVLAADPP
jgi:hypothetical protein